MPLETKYIRAIYGCAREYRIDNELLHEMIARNFSKDSVKKLTRKQALSLLDLMRRGNGEGVQRRHARSRHGRKNYDATGDVVHLVGPKELGMVRKAAALRGWSDETLQKFSRRQCGQLTPRTMAEFNKVWWALRSMNQRDGLYRKGIA